MVVAVVGVVGALIVVAWHAFGSVTSSSVAAPLLFPPVVASPADTALPGAGVPVAEGGRRGPTPGLDLGIEFWRLRLGLRNCDGAAVQALGWRGHPPGVNSAAPDRNRRVVAAGG